MPDPRTDALLIAMLLHPEQAEFIAKHADDPEIQQMIAQMADAKEPSDDGQP
jgi:flagellar motor switch protein FliG